MTLCFCLSALCFTWVLDIMISKYCTNSQEFPSKWSRGNKPHLIQLKNMTVFPALTNDMTERIQTFPAYFVIYTQIPTHMFIYICRFKLLSMDYTLIWKLCRRQKHSFHLALHRPPIPKGKYGFHLFLSICRNFVQYILQR